MPTLETGQRFERYRIIQWLGRGVSGESYEAEDTILLRKVTLKLIFPTGTLPDAARRQFFREMQGVSILNHTYLAPVLDYGEFDGKLYVARRFVNNGSLLSRNGRLWFQVPFNVFDAVHYGHQLAQALQHIHNRGYLHGALTLANILVLRGPALNNESDYAPFLIADVDLTHFIRRCGEKNSSPLPINAAPEQLYKRTIPASDQFALAVLLYYWLVGCPPYIGSPEEIEQLKLTETITPLSSLNPSISVEQDGIILRALSVSPEDRYQSVQAFAEALLATLSPKTQFIFKSEPESAILAHLIIFSPYEEDPYTIELHGEEMTIGRAGSSDILLERDDLTSRHHALLKYENDRFTIYDRRSANGVQVNGQLIQSDNGFPLTDGDIIKIGNYELTFRTAMPTAIDPGDRSLASAQQTR